MTQFAADFGAVIATNAGFFGVTSSGVGVEYSLAAANSTLLSHNIETLTRSGVHYNPTRCAFGFDDTDIPDAYWVYKSDSGGTWAYDSPSMNIQSGDP